jgi:hypothetical protein
VGRFGLGVKKPLLPGSMTVEPFGLNVFPSGSWRHDCSRKHRRRKAKSTGRRSRTLLLACAYRLPVNDNCQCQDSGDSGVRSQDSSEESNPSLRFFVKEPVVALTPSAHLLIGDCCRKELLHPTCPLLLSKLRVLHVLVEVPMHECHRLSHWWPIAT